MPGPYAPTGYRTDIAPQAVGFPGLAATHTNFREWYSWAVVASVVTSAGLLCQTPQIDGNKVDVRVETVGPWQGKQRSINLQLKASSSFNTFTEKGVDYVSKPLTREYYDEMQIPRTVPLFLVLIAVPPLASPWTRVRQGIHALHAAAWWGQLTDPSNGKDNQTVRIPAQQRLDVAGLQAMLQAA